MSGNTATTTANRKLQKTQPADLLQATAFMKHVPTTTSCPAGFGVFSFGEREADKSPLHEATDSRSRPDNPKKPQATEKGRWPGKKRPRPSKLWGAVLRNRTLQKKASCLPESARGQVGCGTSCAAHQPLVAAPLLRTTSLQTSANSLDCATRHMWNPWHLTNAQLLHIVRIASCFHTI